MAKLLLLATMLCSISIASVSYSQEQASAPTPSTPPTAKSPEQPPKPEVLNADDYKHKCGRVYLHKDDKLDLKEMEERLICGDKEGGEIGNPWSNIPGNQAA